MVKIRVRVERTSPLVTGRRWRLLFIKNFHWNRNRSLSSLRKQPFLLATRPARSETVPPLSQGLDDRPPPPPLIWMSGSATALCWWSSGESTRLPPIWPGLKSQSRRHIRVEFVVSSCPCSERFFSGYSCFPLSSKPTFSNYNSIWNVRFNEFLGAFHSTKIPVWNFGNFTCPMERYITVARNQPKPPRVWLFFL